MREMITDRGDARFAIDQFARWIATADTKASLLAAALVIMGGALGDQGRTVGHRLPPTSFADWLSLVALLAATGAIVPSVRFLAGVVRPRAAADVVRGLAVARRAAGRHRRDRHVGRFSGRRGQPAAGGVRRVQPLL